jgi:hypothetical protein
MNKLEIVNRILTNIDDFIGKQSKEVIPSLFPIKTINDKVENDAHCIWWNLPFLSYLGYAPITKTNVQVIKRELELLL